MTCCQLCELLCDFLGNELNGEQQQLVKEHLDGCSCCATYFETYRLIVKISRVLPARPLPPDLVARVKSAFMPSGPSATA